MIKDIRKSNDATNTPEKGMINLGKYIFLITFALFIMLFEAVIKPELKRFQKSKPEK